MAAHRVLTPSGGQRRFHAQQRNRLQIRSLRWLRGSVDRRQTGRFCVILISDSTGLIPLRFADSPLVDSVLISEDSGTICILDLVCFVLLIACNL